MTATSAPVRPSLAGRWIAARPPSFGRMLLIEVRRSPMPLILPLIAALFWFDSYRPSTSQPPLYALVTFWNMGQGHTFIDFGPFVAGMAAWIGSRDGRRGMADLVTATPRPRWIAHLAAWAATAIWAVAAYLVFTGVMFAVYAQRGVQGEPPWWWVAVGATVVVAFSAAGFTAGTLLPNRFIAPIAAFGGFLVLAMSSQIGFSNTSGWALILPTNGHFQQDSGIFYPWLPDLPIARIMLMAGIAVAAVGLAGLPSAAGGRSLRMTAAVVTAAGVAAAGTAVGLATTARQAPNGIVVPALHNAASDRPIVYTPACDGSAFRVCLNPAYRGYLAEVTQALAPAAAEVAGLPGAPARAEQVAAVDDAGEGQTGQPLTITGNPPVLWMPFGANDFLPVGFSTQPGAIKTFDEGFQLVFFIAFVGAGNGPGTQAQQAVQALLLQGAGVPFAAQPSVIAGITNEPTPAATGPIYAAARRLAAQPASVRHAWLAAHLAALRAGLLTLQDIP